MIRYWNIRGSVRELPGWEHGCWTRVSIPDAVDIEDLRCRYDIPEFFFTDINDVDELPRYDEENGWSLIIIRIPFQKPSVSRTPYVTIPFGIIFKDDVLITICNFQAPMVDSLVDYQRMRGCGFIDTVDFIFKMFLVSSMDYLKFLKQINLIIEKAKKNLDNVIDNKALISLSRLQDSLTYFITSIKGNESLLAKLKSKLPIDALDRDLIEDVNIEINQAKETTQIYSEIMDSTMNTYSSIINNNMNTVMKILTSVSIILMFPTLIASFFGMNLINGMEERGWGFPLAIILSVIVSITCWLFFRRKRLI